MNYIYALIDPRTQQCRYVGKTKNPKARMQQHANPKWGYGLYRKHWVESVLASGYKPEMVVLEDVEGEAWRESEQFWIANRKFMGASLVNGTIGGDGTSGYSHTKEAKQKLSETKVGEKNPSYGKTYSTEDRKRISESLKGIKRSDETRKKMSEVKKRENLSAETRRKRSESQRGRIRSPETIEKLCLARRKRVISDETRQKQSCSMKLRWAQKKMEV